MMIPVRIQQTRTAESPRESAIGLFCQILSTSFPTMPNIRVSPSSRAGRGRQSDSQTAQKRAGSPEDKTHGLPFGKCQYNSMPAARICPNGGGFMSDEAD